MISTFELVGKNSQFFQSLTNILQVHYSFRIINFSFSSSFSTESTLLCLPLNERRNAVLRQGKQRRAQQNVQCLWFFATVVSRATDHSRWECLKKCNHGRYLTLISNLAPNLFRFLCDRVVYLKYFMKTVIYSDNVGGMMISLFS